MIQFSQAAKNYFFDRDKVLGMVDKAEGIAMNKVGGRIRLTAMRSMRSQKKPKKGPLIRKASAPGKPPRRHTDLGKGLTRIWYTYDPKRHRVVIGPMKFNWSVYPEATVPELHEFGGSVTVSEVEYTINTNAGRENVWVAVAKRRLAKATKEGRPIRRRKAKYPARPFMRPALEKNMQFIRDTWSAALTGVS